MRVRSWSRQNTKIKNSVFDRLQEHDEVTAISPDSSEQLVLQSHVVLRLEAEESTENVGESSTLLGESVDDRSASWSEGCLTMLAICKDHTDGHSVP
jgi:hypothetical protein